MSFKNKSQLSELSLTSTQLYTQRVRKPREWMAGNETPLGHVYSLLIEAYAKEGLTEPPVGEFLEYLRKRWLRAGDYHSAKCINLQRTALAHQEMIFVDELTESQGLSLEGRMKLLFNCTGILMNENTLIDDAYEHPEKLFN